MSFFKKIKPGKKTSRDDSHGRDYENSHHEDNSHHHHEDSSRHDDARLIDHLNEHRDFHGYNHENHHENSHHHETSHHHHENSYEGKQKTSWMGAAKIAITPGVVTGGVIIGVAVVMTLLLVNFASMTYIPSGFIGLVSGFIVMLALAKFTKLGHPKTHEMY